MLLECLSTPMVYGVREQRYAEYHEKPATAAALIDGRTIYLTCRRLKSALRCVVPCCDI